MESSVTELADKAGAGDPPHRTVSVVFRALNEEKWFEDALKACRAQDLPGWTIELVLVDSGSTDRTLDIAEAYGCRITHIKRADFTFGRSLNYGCEIASGEILVFISAHCIPAATDWLARLIAPLDAGAADYVYGRQIGHAVTRFSEHQIFAKYFPPVSQIPQDGFFANNANSAVCAATWRRYRFDENVTGLEDMVLARAIVRDGGRIGYVAEAPVVHIHEESLKQTRRRYYREALTLREIMPEVHFHFGDFVRYVAAAIRHDFGEAIRQKRFMALAGEIVAFRVMQFWGAYMGHNEHRTLSRAQKESYYYPQPEKHARPGLHVRAQAPAGRADASPAE